VQDVVVVTFNHRVGPWGFLKTKDLTGNYGLSDIVNAVKVINFIVLAMMLIR
jgi:carboxylesterase type B